MKAVIQRVQKADVTVNGELVSSIQNGMLIFLGIAENDSELDIQWLINKIVKLRMFNEFDDNINDINGEILLISQFTLQANVLKGNRPSFIKAAKPESELNKKLNKELKSGVFGADMLVHLSNDGPVTILYDSILKIKR